LPFLRSIVLSVETEDMKYIFGIDPNFNADYFSLDYIPAGKVPIGMIQQAILKGVH